MKKENLEKQEYVLQIALRTFLRYGFKKTSMEDIAKAAGLTRQGLYFRFQNKDELLKCSVEKALDDSMQAVTLALDTKVLSLEEWIFHALDAWFGCYVGLFTPESIPDWEFHCNRVMGEEVEQSNAQFRRKLTAVILSSPETAHLAPLAETAVEMLWICGQKWKRTLDSHDAFAGKMREAIHLCCQI